MMNQKEHLIKRIEEEREKLNAMLASGSSVEETYGQSLVVDRLIEEYMDFLAI